MIRSRKLANPIEKYKIPHKVTLLAYITTQMKLK